MSVQVGSMFASLSLDTAQFVRGAGKADKTFGTLVTNLRRNADGSARSLDNMARVFGSTGFASGARVFGELNQQARALPVSIGAVSTALAGLGGLFAGSALTRSLDTFTSIQNQLASLDSGLGNTSSQFETLLAIANRSRSDIGATVTLFSRLAKSQPELGFDRIARSVETIQKALQLGGATTAEAASAAIQFSQAIGSGVLQGDELRAVLESPLGNALARGLKLTTAEMRKLGSEGKLTSSVVLKALEEIAPAIDDSFGKSTATIGQSFVRLQNQITAAVGKFDESFGASRLIGAGLDTVAANLDGITRAAEASAVAVAAIGAGRIGGSSIAALGAAMRSLGADAQVGVQQATGQIGVLEDALKRALLERQKLTGFVGPMNSSQLDGFNKALALSNSRISELTGVLPRARSELVAAQRAASGWGLAMTGARGAVGSLVGFLGGPWGVAFMAAAAGAALLGARMAAAAQEARNFEEVSSRLLGSVAESNSKAADLVAIDKFNADLGALTKDADTARRELERLLNPVIQIAAEIDDLRETGGEFRLFPDAVRTVEFIQMAVDKLVKGGTLAEFNASLDSFQQRYSAPAAGGLFEEIADQAAEAEKAIEVLSIATERLKAKQAQGAPATGFPGRETATEAALAALQKDAGTRAQADSILFAQRVGDIKSREQKIVADLTAAISKAGGTLNSGLQAYIGQIARTQALVEQITTASVAGQQPFQITQNPNLRYPPGKGPNAALEQANQAIELAKLLEAANKIRTLKEQVSAEQQTIGNTGGLLNEMFGSAAETEQVRTALSGVEADIQKVFTEFRSGKITAVEAFNAIEAIRAKLVELGAEPAPLAAFMEQINSAITGIPSLIGQIQALTREMRALASASNSVKLPGGAKLVKPPGDSQIPGFATGGAFRVGGGGGTDSQLVQFMASPSETVAVFTPSQIRAMEQNGPGPGAGSIAINQSIAIATPDAQSFRNSRRQVQMDMADAVQAAMNRTR